MINPPDDPALPDLPPPAQPVIVHVGPSRTWLVAFLVVALLGGAIAGAVAGTVASKSSSDDGASISVASVAPSGGDAASAAAFAMPSVVTIINESAPKRDAQGREYTSVASGTGVIVDDRGFVVTNQHVINEGGKLTVVLNNGEERPATRVSDDAPFTDLAVLRIPPGGLKALPVGDSEQLKPGQPVVAIGSALYEFHNSVSTGVVSGLHRRWLRQGVYMEDLVQTDAAINHGNSGGPLLNTRGEVVGITTNVVRNFGDDSLVVGISFAISSRTFQPIVKAIIATGRFPRPYFGIDHTNLDAEIAAQKRLRTDTGALVDRVLDGSPAQKAGLRAGDVILRIGSKDVDDETPFINALAAIGVNDRVPLKVLRDNQVYDLMMTVTPR
jgi:2-alkenal reductase